MNITDFWRDFKMLRAENKALRAMLKVYDKKLSTPDARNLHMWALGMIIEGRQPIKRYFEVCNIIEWYTKMDNVILDQVKLLEKYEKS